MLQGRDYSLAIILTNRVRVIWIWEERVEWSGLDWMRWRGERWGGGEVERGEEGWDEVGIMERTRGLVRKDKRGEIGEVN